MLIKTNDKNEISDFSTFGGLNDAVVFDEELLPDGFEENFKPGLYLLINGEVVLNDNYSEHKEQPVAVTTDSDKQLAQVIYQQMMTTQDVTTLQTQNAQMAYQLMMIQQGGEA